MNPERARLYEILSELRAELETVQLDEARATQLESLINSIEARIAVHLDEDPQQDLLDDLRVDGHARHTLPKGRGADIQKAGCR